ncbi:type I-G CRISPR-associated protein, Cas3-extension family [Endozoicomonas sp. ALB032]|uniref:type I-G CRISPR-associated protein, Cas3-extension family n=1 Tax=Endozoicomonas sp. ALB032 TaxID=3403082 RepID=UPI003BB7064F
MSKLSLPGLDGRSPMGVMAACGLLRVITRMMPERLPKLSWVKVSRTAELHMPDGAETLETILMRALEYRLNSRVLTLGDDIKLPPEEYQRWVLECLSDTSDGTYGDDLIEFMPAFGSDQITQSVKNAIKTTPFHMTAGQQRFLRMVRELVQTLGQEESIAEKMNEALFEPWAYRDKVHSMGWNPAGERTHAYQQEAPSKSKAKGVMLAVWLAFEALPLFPCMATGRKLRTSAFTGYGRKQFFHWSLWFEPISLIAVKTLNSHMGKEMRGADVPVAGLYELYSSRRMPLGDKGFSVFKPSVMGHLR